MRDLRLINEDVNLHAAQIAELRQVVAKLVEDNARTTAALLQLQQQRQDGPLIVGSSRLEDDEAP